MHLTLLLLLIGFSGQLYSQAEQKPRIFILTDIENEPDDAESMVRFLLYSNMFDVEALVATTSTHLRDKTAEWRIKEIVTAYGKVRNNLLLHEKGYPTEEYLHSVTKKGIPRYGMTGVGEGMDSEGSEWLIKAVDKKDPRPLWVPVWGGPNVLAQALWKVRQSRSPKELDEFVSKIRVYTISDQDDSGAWLRKEFPGLFYIVSPGGNYRNATWSGISGEPWYHFASGADTSLVRNTWLKANIMENHGPLGAEYPMVEYAMEGDTPSFLGLITNGLNVPDRPDFGGWGGRYELYTPRFLPYKNDDNLHTETRPIWTDATDEVTGKDGRIYIDNHATIWRWRDAYQNDFAARMDWSIKTFKEANHPPVVNLEGAAEINVKVGEWVTLDASKSTDPDNNTLSYHWFHYPEPGTFWSWRSIVMENTESSTMRFRIHPEVDLTKPQTTHLILEVMDNGTPALTRYQRVIVNVFPK
ncbi:MAG: DUF1593 domain-containing protein [Cyclobacteriaceae bacterium]|nr:DUF1593 domain-containing protein [Cyclobacteriaceae bacterium]